MTIPRFAKSGSPYDNGDDRDLVDQAPTDRDEPEPFDDAYLDEEDDYADEDDHD